MGLLLGQWSKRKLTGVAGVIAAFAGLVPACGNPEIVTHDDRGAPGGTAGNAGVAGIGGTVSIDGGGNGGTGGDGGAPGPCVPDPCPPGQRCVEEADAASSCVDRTCSELNCAPTELCVPHPQGGNVCQDNTCNSDVDCALAEFCDGTKCVDDVCTPGESRCEGQAVVECSSNGGNEGTKFQCGSPAYFTSDCQDDGTGRAFCPCEDDWDCPANTVCDVDRCVGTGNAPTCTLPPVAFSDVPPEVEIHWGGVSRSNDAAHDGTAAQNPAPWSQFGQVVNTPIVANLDDDNQDGLINELDFPEIVFVSYRGDHPWDNGVLRAIHGGGPNKGADYFARCAGKLWTRANPITDACSDSEPDAESGSPAAVADLDYDGVPEIIYVTENNRFRILDNTGALIYTLGQSWTAANEGETIAVANLDFAGNAEIIVGRTVYVLGKDSSNNLIVTHIYAGNRALGRNEISMMACPADLVSAQPGLEIVAGATLYRLPTSIPACATPPCAGALEVVWNAPDLPGQSARITGEGFCAVADVWGANPAVAPGPANPPDGKAEVILIDDGDLTILNGETGAIIDDRTLGGGDRGGAPNVDDFDGDGFMEIASALQDFYVVKDLQVSTGAGGSCPSWPAVIARQDQPGGAHNPNPARTPGGACTQSSQCDANAVCNTTIGQCVCLHNGWSRDSDDDSSKATSSSVFDFNGDGAAEVLYNDECNFRVYDGRNGEVYFSQLSRSRTGIENPVVADVDNDGNAEVVAVMNTEQINRCDDDPGGIPLGPNGIRVWGDPSDRWVSARRIWNEQSYHVTNVTEAGGLPMHEPESWRTYNGRYYNTYRSQPRSFGVAPDLTVVDVGISSPDAECGQLSDTIEIAFEIKNQGDLRVGPGVKVTFLGFWGATQEVLLDANGNPLEVMLQNSLEPGSSIILSVGYQASYNNRPTLPDRVRVIVDEADIERECNESNNSADADVEAGTPRADLRIALDLAVAVCPNATVETTVFNDGTAPASNVVVRYYAGDPSQGGTVLHEEIIAGPIAPGASVSFVATIPNLPKDRSITIFAIVDPDDAIEECNEANNRDSANNAVICSGGPA